MRRQLRLLLNVEAFHIHGDDEPGLRQGESFMTLGAIVVCRLDSDRLPGKVLRNIKRKPLLEYVLSRSRQVKALGGNIVVATSNRPADDPIEDYCHEHAIRTFRGAAEDVAGRVLNCAKSFALDHFLRVNADSPFLDPRLVTEACTIAESGEYDIVTNLYPRSFPYGISVELIKTTCFETAYRQMWSDYHFEHMTTYLYENMASLKFYNIPRNGDDLSACRLTVDTEEDCTLFEQFLDTMEGPWETASYLSAVAVYRHLRGES